MRRAGALSDEIFAALAERAVHAAGRERELAWWVERSFREAGAEGVSFPKPSSRPARPASSPHAVPGDEPIEAGVLVTVDAGCILDGYCSDCTRTFAVRRRARAALGALRALPRGAARRARGRRAPACTGATPTPLPGRRSRRPGSAGRTVTDSGTASASRSTRGRCSGRSRRTCSSRGTSSRSSPGSTSPARAGVRIEDLVLVTDDGCERLTQFTKELLTVD